MMTLNNNMVLYYKTEKSDDLNHSLDRIADLIGGMESIVKPGQKVLIKPNLVAPFKKAVTGNSLIQWVIDKVKKCGATPIIGESSGFEFNTEYTFEILGLVELAKKNDVRLVNFDQGEFISVPIKNYSVKEFLVSKDVLDCDVLINLPKLKGHALTKVTFGMKNLFGVLHRETRRKIHAVNLEKGIFLLNQIIKPDLTIVDGLWTLPKAVFSDPSYKGVIIAGTDPVFVDYVCCEAFGINFSEVKHINMAYTLTGKAPFNIMRIPSDNGNNIQPLNLKRKLGYQLYNTVYQFMYLLDSVYSKVFKSKTIIPDIHLNLGIKPIIQRKMCNNCGNCIKTCPVKAIDINVTIDYSKCKYVRCLRCIDCCPTNAISIRGFHRKGV